MVSLKPFLTEGFRLTERTVRNSRASESEISNSSPLRQAGSPLAILRMQKHRYPPNSVSWTNE